ncbi:phosphatase PAP2 family protein [Thermus filiformis]|nr:phosphatase PAP2 family protein [Thermus filiformis]
MRAQSLAPLLLWLFLAGGAAAFLELAEDVYRHEGFFFDAPLLAWLYAHRTPALDRAMRLLSFSASVQVLAPLSLVLAFWLWRRKGRWAFFLLGVGGAALLNLLLKEFFARGRPHLFPPLAVEKDYSFPSGHAMGSLAFALALGLALKDLHPRLGRAVLVLGVLWSLAVGLSRLYLQVHYPSDVLAGFLAAALWVGGVYLGTRR